MCQRLQPTLSAIEQEFIRPEAERLLEEIANPATSHQRRAIIGDRLAEIGDPRPGVGLDSNGVPALCGYRCQGERLPWKMRPGRLPCRRLPSVSIL